MAVQVAELQHDRGGGGLLDLPADLVPPEAGREQRRLVAEVGLLRGGVLGRRAGARGEFPGRLSTGAQVSPRGGQRGQHLVEEVVRLLMRPAPALAAGHLTAAQLHGVDRTRWPR